MSSSGQYGTLGAGGKKRIFSGKKQVIASLSIALASHRDKSGEFQIFLSVVKFGVQMPLLAPLRARDSQHESYIATLNKAKHLPFLQKKDRNNAPALQ